MAEKPKGSDPPPGGQPPSGEQPLDPEKQPTSSPTDADDIGKVHSSSDLPTSSSDPLARTKELLQTHVDTQLELLNAGGINEPSVQTMSVIEALTSIRGCEWSFRRGGSRSHRRPPHKRYICPSAYEVVH